MDSSWSDLFSYNGQPVYLQLFEQDLQLGGRHSNGAGPQCGPYEMGSDSSSPTPIHEHVNTGTQTQGASTGSGTSPVPGSTPFIPGPRGNRDEHDNKDKNKPKDKSNGIPISFTFSQIHDGTFSLHQTNATSSTMYAETPSSIVMRGLALASMVGVSCLVWMNWVKPGA